MNLSKLISRALTSTALFAISASTVFAMGGRSSRPGGSSESNSYVASSQWSSGGNSAATGGRPSNVASVPEIDASTGLLAIAAVLAIVVFVWERNHRLQK